MPEIKRKRSYSARYKVILHRYFFERRFHSEVQHGSGRQLPSH